MASTETNGFRWQTSLILALGFAGGIALIGGIVLFARPAALLILAICIASALTPAVRLLSRRLPRTLSILVLYLGIVLLIMGAVGAFIPTLLEQGRGLAQRLPDLLEQGRAFLEQNGISDAQLEPLLGSIAEGASRLFSAPVSLLGAILDGVVVLITSLYLMLWAARIRAFVLSLFAGDMRAQAESVGLELVQVAGGYVRGVGFNILLVSTVTTLGLSLIGIPYALLLGIFAGLMEMLPTIGSIIAAVPILIIAVLQSPGTAIITLVFVLAVQQIQGNLISPNVMKEQAQTPQFLVPLALIAGASVGGLLGALISVPLLAMIRVLVLRVIAPFIRRQTGAAA